MSHRQDQVQSGLSPRPRPSKSGLDTGSKTKTGLEY